MNARQAALYVSPIDPGLQAERTALAWNRTALAILVNGLLALRSAWSMQQHVITAFALAVIACAMVTFVHGAVRGKELLRGVTPRAAAPIWMAAVAALSFLACVVAISTLIAPLLQGH